jgi:hypothetical protein
MGTLPPSHSTSAWSGTIPNRIKQIRVLEPDISPYYPIKDDTIYMEMLNNYLLSGNTPVDYLPTDRYANLANPYTIFTFPKLVT